MNSNCYRKFHNSSSLTWYNASNDCLSRGGSLAVFIDIGRPSDNRQLTEWLNTSGTNKTYWIGLIRSWWMTTDECEFELLRKQCAGYDNVFQRLRTGLCDVINHVNKNYIVRYTAQKRHKILARLETVRNNPGWWKKEEFLDEKNTVKQGRINVSDICWCRAHFLPSFLTSFFYEQIK